MHIGLDLGLQMNNSNLFNKLEKEGKDFLLNRTVRNIVSEQVNLDRQTVFNLESYSDIKQYSSLLSPLLKTKVLQKSTGNGYYDYGVLPVDLTPITTGRLYAGREYRVTVAGTTNLSTFGSTSPPIVGAIFTCVLATANATALEVGATYRILTKGTSDFTLAGAINNMVGTEFIATGTTIGTGTATPLSLSPTWAGGTTLEFTYSEDVFEELSSVSNVDTGYPFAIGGLVKGTTYKIITGGTITGLTLFGSISNTVEAGYTFLCTLTGVPTWATSGVSMIATKDVLNRLVKVQDVHNFLQNAYGTVTSSPIATLVDNKVYVYHDAKFTINSISLTYVRPPKTISSTNNTDCDLALKFHNKVVDDTVSYTMSFTNNPAYQAFINENKTAK